MPLDFSLQKETQRFAKAYSSADLEKVALLVLREQRVRGSCAITLRLTHDKGIQQLSRHYIGEDHVTDVIAFNYQPAPDLEGDVAINVQQAERQAKEVGHSLRQEIRLLLIHGLLHMLGYDDHKPNDRKKMFQRQNTLLKRHTQNTK